MELVSITVTMNTEQRNALEFSLRKKNTTVQKCMENALKTLYETEVPDAVREYLGSQSVAKSRPKRRPKRDKDAPAEPAEPDIS